MKHVLLWSVILVAVSACGMWGQPAYEPAYEAPVPQVHHRHHAHHCKHMKTHVKHHAAKAHHKSSMNKTGGKSQSNMSSDMNMKAAPAKTGVQQQY